MSVDSTDCRKKGCRKRQESAHLGRQNLESQCVSRSWWNETILVPWWLKDWRVPTCSQTMPICGWCLWVTFLPSLVLPCLPVRLCLTEHTGRLGCKCEAAGDQWFGSLWLELGDSFWANMCMTQKRQGCELSVKCWTCIIDCALTVSGRILNTSPKQ